MNTGVDLKRRNEAISVVRDLILTDPVWADRDKIALGDVWDAHVERCAVFPLCRDERVIGAVMVSPEGVMHIAVESAARGKWLSRKLIKDILGNSLEEFEAVAAPVHRDNWVARRFVEGLGFDAVAWSDGGHYVIYERRGACHAH